MSHWFTTAEVQYMSRIRDNIGEFEYNTFQAWSHGDLNHGNVLYDKETSTISFIDFAEANYQFIYHDIFSPLQIELGICKSVYQKYTEFHDTQKYKMPGNRNEILRMIMMYRIMGVYLKRFIKASDDLRLNPQNDKSIANNNAKVEFMRQLMTQILNTEHQFIK